MTVDEPTSAEPAGPPYRLLDPGPRFKKDVRRLDPAMKAELSSVLDDLVSGSPLPRSRRHKKLKGPGEFHSLRLSRKVRFVYMRLAGGFILPYAVGPHDDAYQI